MSDKQKSHYVYIIQFADGDYYVGKRSCYGDPELDKYAGSGKRLKYKQKKYPGQWTKTILLRAKSEEQAYLYEACILADDYMTDKRCLNLVGGGRGISSEFMRNMWADPDYRAAQEKARLVEMELNGFKVCVEASEVRSLLLQGYEFTAKTVWVRSDLFKTIIITRPKRARQLIVNTRFWDYGKHADYKRITLKQIHPLTGVLKNYRG